MQIKQITEYLESFAPLAFQESYDNAGLIIGQPDDEVSGILITLDITEEILDEAISKNLNLIIAHHPIIFAGIKKLNGKNYIERCITKAIKKDLVIYAAHTNLDSVFGGVNSKICEKLRCQKANERHHQSAVQSRCGHFNIHTFTSWLLYFEIQNFNFARSNSVTSSRVNAIMCSFLQKQTPQSSSQTQTARKSAPKTNNNMAQSNSSSKPRAAAAAAFRFSAGEAGREFDEGAERNKAIKNQHGQIRNTKKSRIGLPAGSFGSAGI